MLERFVLHAQSNIHSLMDRIDLISGIFPTNHVTIPTDVILGNDQVHSVILFPKMGNEPS